MFHLPPFGQTRTQLFARHALISDDGHVMSALTGIENVRWVAHITPAMGANFAQSTLTFSQNGSVRFPECSASQESEHVLFLWKGSAILVLDGTKKEPLTAGSFVYLPPRAVAQVITLDETASLVWFEKKYVPSATAPGPEAVVGHADKVAGVPFLGNPRAILQTFLPDHPSFDLAVNLFTYQPGAGLPFVETHVMEHGLLMTSGRGIYRLEDQWYPVVAGDVIWMAPYCPQWFAALGDEPAAYLYYKDVNRPLL